MSPVQAAGAHPFRRLPEGILANLAQALEAGWLEPPYSPIALQRFVGDEVAGNLAEELTRLATSGLSAEHLAFTIRLLVEEREEAQRARDGLELVWTGPAATVPTRDTAVVVRDLFLSARHSVIVSTFAVFQGRHVFKPLADRMDANPELDVRLFVNIHRQQHDAGSSEAAVDRFKRDFREHEWPGERFPALYYDPRSLDLDSSHRACLHAKVVVVDDSRAFLTSANFTEAAQERNVEAGLLVEDATLAKALRCQFDALVASGAVVPVY